MRWLPNWVAKRPASTEFDFSGIVVDANDTKSSNGDKIFGWLDVMGYAFPTRQGTLSQYIKVPARMAALRPTHKAATETAGITLAALTAYQGLYATANVQPGQTIFVNGGSSSVGAFAIQIAKAKGAKTVVASCSPKSAAFVKSLGADEVVDYTIRPLHETLRSLYPVPVFDAFIDAGTSPPSFCLHVRIYSHVFRFISRTGRPHIVYIQRFIPQARCHFCSHYPPPSFPCPRCLVSDRETHMGLETPYDHRRSSSRLEANRRRAQR